MTNNKTKIKTIVEAIEIYPIRNKYISGICKSCDNDFTDLEMHYSKYPVHRM